jgi:EmrB/QacA subfamily drug resistance transporter
MLRAFTSTDTRWAALAVLCVGMLMIVLDGTIVNVALPSIQSDLGFTSSNLAWVINAYMIAFGGLLLLSGRLGDLIGSRRVFIAGLCLFTFASLLCGIAWTRDLLVAARFVQGIGGAMASSVILSMIVTMFTDPEERTKAMGFFNFTASAGGSIGLLLGGSLTQVANWHWVFLVNLPIGIAAVFLAARYVKSSSGQGLGAGADLLGAVLITASLMLAVYTVVEMPAYGVASVHTCAFAAVTLALFAAFIGRQMTAAHPLLALSVFRSRNLTGSSLVQVFIVAAMFGFFFLDSLYFRRTLGYNAIATGLAFLPVTLAIGALSLGWSAQLAMRFGARNMIVFGVGISALGLAWAAATPIGSNYGLIFPSMLLLGIGMGVAFPSLMMFAMSTATNADSGLISGLIQTTAQVGGAFGLAILATIAAVSSYPIAFGIAAACLVLACTVAGTVLRYDELAPEAIDRA